MAKICLQLIHVYGTIFSCFDAAYNAVYMGFAWTMNTKPSLVTQNYI